VTRKRWELAVATAAAWIAFARAFLPASPLLHGIAAAIALAAAVVAVAFPWRAAPPRVARWASLILRLLLVVVGGLVVFARQFPLVRDDNARVTGALAGVALALLAFAFLAGQRVWAVHTHLVPAVIGVLVAAGLERTGVAFPFLAALAGLAVWLDAFRTGGPRRFGLPALATGVASGALAGAIAWALPVAQPLVQDFVARAYSEGQTGLSDHSQLGDVASLARSRRVVARVWTDRPQPLRLQAFARFDGRHWAAFPSDGQPMRRSDRARLGALLDAVPGDVFASTDEGPETAYVSETRVMPALWMEDGWGLLTPAGARRVVWPHEGLALDDRGLVRTGGATAHLYGIANQPFTQRRLAPTRVDLAPPLRLDPRVRALAESLRRGEAPGPALVARTVEHLRTSYRYTLEVGRFQTGDPLAEFLFDKRAGYCEYFATAAVVLLRLQGVPARYVKGVSVRADRRIGEHYVVRESDAHAWADVWTEETGWAEVDPTPEDGWNATHPDESLGTFEVAWEQGLAWVTQVWARWRQETWPWLAAGFSRARSAAWSLVLAHRRVVAALGVTLAVMFALARRRRTRPRPKVDRLRARLEPDLARALQRVERHWTRAGQPRPSSRGLVEHLAAMPEDALSAEARALSRQVVDAVYASAFAGRPPAPAEVASLDASTRALP
jgi:transglutaminase-like putative cysteine protease